MERERERERERRGEGGIWREKQTHRQTERGREHKLVEHFTENKLLLTKRVVLFPMQKLLILLSGVKHNHDPKKQANTICITAAHR